MDALVNQFNNTSIYQTLSQNFIKDLNIIIRCIANHYKYYNTFKIDIYDLLVSNGSDLTWNMDYFITTEEHNWFINQGNVYIFHQLSLSLEIQINNISFDEYNNLMVIFEKLIELYSLVI